MRSRRAAWHNEQTTEEQRELLLVSMLSKGKTAGAIATQLATSELRIEDTLVRLRAAGRVRCTNKTWFRADALQYVGERKPKKPRLSAAQKKLLERQERLFE